MTGLIGGSFGRGWAALKAAGWMQDNLNCGHVLQTYSMKSRNAKFGMKVFRVVLPGDKVMSFVPFLFIEAESLESRDRKPMPISETVHLHFEIAEQLGRA
jgi:hypothetical protein